MIAHRFRRVPLALESLEQRLVLSGETFLVNFQLAGAPIPNRYLADTGEIFGNRGNGLSYGWSTDHTDVSRDRGVDADQRLDTLIHFHQFQSWNFQLPNGRYEVTVSIGDPSFSSDHTLFVEGTNYWNGVALSAQEFRVLTREIIVNDGRLTLDQGNAIEKATRINYVHIQGLPTPGNAAPLPPTITEPAANAGSLSPSDVHMEAMGFFDPDGDGHLSTDWEIWTRGPSAERVWFTLGITGVERLHTHLGDGFFENSLAGRSALAAETVFELRVRFRDAAGSVSLNSSRLFETGVVSTIFPLSMEDIAEAPVPTWTTPSGFAIDLPGAGSGTMTAPSLRAESGTGELLLAMEGSNLPGNMITNPAPLANHAEVRVVLRGGTPGLNLGPTNLMFVDDHGQDHTVFLPTIVVAPHEEIYFWVALDGSTYYGQAAQTEPDFTNLARSADSASNFIATQPGYVVEVVAGGFQLPVNVAFVPNPGPDPGDPSFYVTELYGTIKVVTNDGTVSDYATGLLNFNPTGNFPGSGEQGLAGIVVDPATGDVFVSRVTDTDGLPGGDHHPQVVRFSSNDGGLTAAASTVILDMVGETQGQSHQISNLSIGPDGKLYVHNGDGFDASTALNLDSYRGKVLRVNFDGSAPGDNPFYDAGNGINARDYVFASGFRNPFGGAWRASDGGHYEVENGPSVDRFARVVRGGSYGWNGTNASMFTHAIYNWDPAHAPVNVAFVQSATFGGSQFPEEKLDRAFVSESGPTYGQGPQALGKRIVEFELDAGGNVVGGPTTLVEYVGPGRATVVGLTAGPDGLYFTDLYKDLDAQSPIDAGARVLRVRYVPSTPDGDFNDDGLWNCVDIDALVVDIAAQNHNPAFDLTGDGLVNQDDLQAWLVEGGAHNPTATSGNPFLPGDANLDGSVDGSDFSVWNAHKFANVTGWCRGDVTADGAVDGSDFNVWNSHKFTSSAVLRLPVPPGDRDDRSHRFRSWSKITARHTRSRLGRRSTRLGMSRAIPRTAIAADTCGSEALRRAAAAVLFLLPKHDVPRPWRNAAARIPGPRWDPGSANAGRSRRAAISFPVRARCRGRSGNTARGPKGGR